MNCNMLGILEKNATHLCKYIQRTVDSYVFANGPHKKGGRSGAKQMVNET